MSNAFVKKTTSPSQNGEEGCSNTLKEKKRFVPIYHYCNIPGHIRPRCFKLIKDMKEGRRIAYWKRISILPRRKVEVENMQRRISIRKTGLSCLVAYTSLKACSRNS